MSLTASAADSWSKLFTYEKKIRYILMITENIINNLLEHNVDVKIPTVGSLRPTYARAGEIYFAPLY